MGLVRTAKSLSVRLDNRYITRPNRGRLFRKLLIGICSFAVLVGWGVYVGRGDKTPYSPGPLTSAHGMWDGNNCAWCHETKPEGGFVLTVSNTACMTCHDGSVHHPNSKMKFVDAATGGPVRDAGQCTACHVEHRGHERLVARADNTCTQCHAELDSKVAPKAERPEDIKVQPMVTAFVLNQHPEFGRSLTDSKKWAAGTPQLRDPTPLMYNHKAHQEDETKRTKPLPGQTENCTACHRSDGGGPARGDIAPVNFEMDCAQCHKLSLPGGLPVPHEELSVARTSAAGALANLPTQFRKQLDAMPEAERTAEVLKFRPKPAAPKPAGGGIPGRRPAAVPATPAAPAAPLKPPTAAELDVWAGLWAADKAKTAEEAMIGWYTEKIDGDAAGFGAFVTAAKLAQPADENFKTTAPWRDERVVGFYLARGVGKIQQCAECHQLSDQDAEVAALMKQAGPPMAAQVVRKLRPTPPTATSAATRGVASQPAIPTAAIAAGQPATAATPDPAEAAATLVSRMATLHSLPTGYAGGPRRWFVSDRLDMKMSERKDRALFWPSSSHFDHRAHRMVSCLDCHGKAKTSEATRDVLMPSMGSCTECHAPKVATGAQGAEARCQVCHNYHDRSQERPIDGRYQGKQLLTSSPPTAAPPATAPAVAEGSPVVGAK
jgi:predicted CXXCH cytochrome family protein